MRTYVLDTILGPLLHQQMVSHIVAMPLKIKAPFPPAFHSVVFGSLRPVTIESYMQAQQVFSTWAIRTFPYNCKALICPGTKIHFQATSKKGITKQMSCILLHYKFFNQHGVLQFHLGMHP